MYYYVAHYMILIRKSVPIVSSFKIRAREQGTQLVLIRLFHYSWRKPLQHEVMEHVPILYVLYTDSIVLAPLIFSPLKLKFFRVEKRLPI